MRHEKETRNFSLPYQRNCFIHFHPKINTSNGSDFSTVGTYDLLLRECGSPAWWWCYLRCSSLADRWPLVPPPHPFLVGCVFSLAPSGSVLERAGEILGWHGQESGAKFFAASTFHFHPFHKSSCCHHGAKFFCSLHKSLSLFHNSSCCKYHLAPPDYGMPPWDLLPPSAGPLRRGHFVLVFPPSIPPLSSLLPWGTSGCLSGWAEASPGAALHGDFFIVDQGLISPFLCLN